MQELRISQHEVFFKDLPKITVPDGFTLIQTIDDFTMEYVFKAVPPKQIAVIHEN